MSTKRDLDAGLERLRNDAAEQNKLYVSSKIALYNALVDTYLWWRTASQRDGYLEEQFEQNRIKYRTQLNRPNFNPVIRLVFNMQQHLQNVQISNWGSALNAIDDEYVRNGHIYRNRDAKAELVDWIDDNGGLRGICGAKAQEIEAHGYDYKDAGNKKKRTNNTEQKAKQRLEVLELKKRAIAGAKTARTFEIGEVGTGDDDLVVVLAKATGNGNELKVVGTTAQQGLVDDAVMSVGEVELANAPTTLRMLCEAINLNTIPKALQKYGARKNFYGKTKIEIERDGKKSKLNEQARLVWQRNGTILVSKTSTEASLTTYYIPSKKFVLEQDIWLRGSDRYWLETELINESEIALYDATDLEEQKNKQLLAIKQVALKNTLIKHQRNIYFYDFSRIDDATMHQPAVVEEGITYDWVVKGNVSFFRRLFEQHFDGWQHRVKHRLHTANNKAVAFDVGEDGIVCEKKWDKAEGCFTQSGTRYLTAFSDDADVVGAGRVMFAPTDIISALEMISKSVVIDDAVEMSGNEDLLFINFRNDIAEIKIFIPSCTITGRRNGKHFKRFSAND